MDRTERLGICFIAGVAAGWLIFLRDAQASPYNYELRLGVAVAVLYVPATLAFFFGKDGWAAAIALAGSVGLFGSVFLFLLAFAVGGGAG